jgi:hypothetical protein
VTGDLTQEGTRPHNDFGGQIWVWRENTFKDYYWLMEGVGTDYDGRWWDDRKGRFASFSLNPGEAYFYRHHVSTNGGVTGTNFEWDMSPP